MPKPTTYVVPIYVTIKAETADDAKAAVWTLADEINDDINDSPPDRDIDLVSAFVGEPRIENPDRKDGYGHD